MKKIIRALAFFFMLAIIPVLTMQQAVASLSEGLIAHYPFDGNANDESGHGNHGIAQGNIIYEPGIMGSAASFDGSSFIRIPYDPSLNPSDQITISFWIYVEEFTNIWSPIIHKGGPHLTGGGEPGVFRMAKK